MPQHRVAEIGEQRTAGSSWISRVDVAADLTVTNGGHHHHRPAEEKEKQAADSADQLVGRRGRPSAEAPRRDLEKEIEFFDEEAERHYGNCGPNPGQIGPLVCRMI